MITKRCMWIVDSNFICKYLNCINHTRINCRLVNDLVMRLCNDD